MTEHRIESVRLLDGGATDPTQEGALGLLCDVSSAQTQVGAFEPSGTNFKTLKQAVNQNGPTQEGALGLATTI